MYNRKIPRLYDCSIEATIEVLAGKWKPYIICYLRDEPKRPSQLLKMMPNANKRVLAQQLKQLEEHGIISKTVYAEVPLRTDYQLTEMGQTLLPIVLSMQTWGDTYRTQLVPGDLKSAWSAAAEPAK